MAKNESGKYLKYAIGEIFLVVIGILIALSLNNWNQNRVNKNILTIYTNQLIEEVELNITKLNKVIDEETKLSKHLDTVVKILQENDLSNPKLLQKSFALLSFEDFHPMTVAFENLKASGEFKLIKNIELRNAISSSYNTFENINLTQDVHFYNMKTRIADYFTKNANYVDFTKSLPNFGKDLEFGNLALGAQSTLIQKIDACNLSVEKMNALKLLLETFRDQEL
jgi:hypothetical protein